jgi:hypothetical protein
MAGEPILLGKKIASFNLPEAGESDIEAARSLALIRSACACRPSYHAAPLRPNVRSGPIYWRFAGGSEGSKRANKDSWRRKDTVWGLTAGGDLDNGLEMAIFAVAGVIQW